MLFWTLYLAAVDIGHAAGDRYNRLAARPEAGDMNISKAIYAALAVALGAIIVGAITAAVTSRLSAVQ